MVSSDSIYCSSMPEKRRSSGTSIVHLIAAVLILSMTICLWRHSECPGPPKPYFFSETTTGYLLVLPGNATSLPPPYQVNTLPRNDMTKLIDLVNFTFLMNNTTACRNLDPLLLVLVHSDPKNVEKRTAIRSTWGSVAGSRFKLLFLVGIPNSKAVQRSLDEENRLNGDVVQGSFIDAYRNMTYKHVMALKWTTYFCPNSKYLLKTDDDVFVNTPALLDYLTNNLSPYGARRLLLCNPMPQSAVKRSARSKWRVTFSEYKLPFYPTYCPGFAIMYSQDVVFTLYAEAQSSVYFWVDDVHITGIMAAKAKFSHSSFKDFVLTWDQFKRFLDTGETSRTFLFGPINLNPNDIKRLWHKVVSLNLAKQLS